MAGGLDLPPLQGGQHGAALLLHVGTVLKLALVHIGRKLREAPGQLLLAHQLHAVHVEGGKTRGVRHHRPAAQAEQLHMAGGVAATAQLFAHVPGGQVHLVVQGV